MKKILIVIFALILVVVLGVSAVIACVYMWRDGEYNNAMELLKNGEYEAAYKQFRVLVGHEDAEDHFNRFYFFTVSTRSEKNGEVKSADYTFGEDKLPKRIDIYPTDGAASDYELIYDDKGRIVEVKCSDESGDHPSIEYSYNESEESVRTVFSFPDGDTATAEEYYDGERKIRELFTDRDGEQTKYEYFYEGVKCIREVITYSDGGRDVTENTYDENNCIIKMVLTARDGRLETTELTHDNYGNLIKAVYTDSEGNCETAECTYDAVGNMIKMISFYADGTSEIKEYTYDTFGNRTKETYTDTEGNITVTETEYMLVYLPIDLSYSERVKLNGISGLSKIGS